MFVFSLPLSVFVNLVSTTLSVFLSLVVESPLSLFSGEKKRHVLDGEEIITQLQLFTTFWFLLFQKIALMTGR